MISKTSIKARAKRKTNPFLVATITLARKHEAWHALAQRLSGATRQHASVNLSQIDAATKTGDTVVVPGKVLGVGNLTKKVRICALSFSASVKEKIKATKSEAVSIIEEIKSNPKATGVKLIS